MTQAGAIHGDYNPSNVLYHVQRPEQIKLLDWEWAGVGVPHADLVSLMKGARPDVEERALRIFADHDRGLGLAEHRRLYDWCKLERGLLDGAFMAAQFLRLPPTTGFNFSGHIEASMRRVLIALQQLA